MVFLLRAVLVTSALFGSGADESFLLADFPASLSDVEWRVAISVYADLSFRSSRREGS